MDLNSPADVLRLAAAILLAIVACQYVLMISHYINYVLPLRKEIDEGKIIAPPAGWTLAYHLVVLAFVLMMIVSRLQVLVSGVKVPFTVATYLTPILSIIMAVVLSKFLTYYSRNLSRATRRPPPRV